MNRRDSLDDGKSQAGAIALRRKERLECPLPSFRRQARPTVGDFNRQACSASVRRNDQFSAVGHDIQRIQQQIQNRAAKHIAIGRDDLLASDIETGANPLSGELRRQRAEKVFQQSAQGERLPLRISIGGEIQQVVHGGVQRSESGGDFIDQFAAALRQPRRGAAGSNRA